MTLSEHLRATILAAFDTIPAGDRADVYALSLYMYDVEDDPRRPTITVGYNTERRVTSCTPAPGQKAKWPIAADAAEARWNHAFWLQNALVVACDGDSDPVGGELVQRWAKDKGYWYSDEDEDRDIDAALRKVEPLTGEFVQMAVAVARDLHSSGEIVRMFGRPLPVLIHELEYYEEIAAQNEAANPGGLVDDFARWVRAQ